MENNETKISEGTEIKGLVCGHLKFIPASQFEEWDGDHKTIVIFTSRINGRNYKVKREIVGYVTACADRKKGEHWHFCPGNCTLAADTVFIISIFLEGMNVGKIKLDLEKGELELL